MRDDEIRSRLRLVNPWWRAMSGGDPTSWAATDRTLRARDRYDLGYRSSVLADVASEPVTDRLVVLRGPRRVGKSVVLKDTAAALCARPDLDPRQLIHLPADGMSAQDLRRTAALGRELTRSVDNDGAVPRIWLLDEVTGIDDWTAALKFLRDNTPFGDDTVVCTGSSWSDTGDVERDLLAGRAGTTATRRTRLLLPMSFRDVLAVTDREAAVPGRLPLWELQSAEAEQAINALEFATDDLDLGWQSYLTSGGFPRAVAEHHRDGIVSPSFAEDLIAWLHQDVDHDAPVDSIPCLLSELHQRSTSPLNRRSTAEKLGYPNSNTFALRLNRLVRSYAGLWCHQFDDAGVRLAGSQSKLYLTDPLLGSLGPLLRAGHREPDMTALTENALAVAIAAAIEAHQPGRWTTGETVGYARTGSGNEVDFGSLPLPSAGTVQQTTPIEAKWVSRGWRSEAKVIEAKYGRGILATKNITDLTTAAWAVPAPVVALLLG